MTAQAQRILGTFDVKPTIMAAGAKPDELMIDWTTLPSGSSARIYLPGIAAADILKAAVRIQGVQSFTAIDAHTIGCAARGIGYVPIPSLPGNLAGLIDVELPAQVQAGSKLTVAVSQITNARAEIVTGRANSGAVAPDARRVKPIGWRTATGVFQLALKVRNETETRPLIAQKLAVLRWIFETIPASSRWHPVFVRYLGALENQFVALGGKPGEIAPSPTGLWPTGRGFGEFRNGIAGKIEGLVFDHFGDFEGFVLESEDAERFHFFSRETGIERVAQRAMTERLRVTVIPEERNDRLPRRIILHPA
jgi:hypothetical protein